MYTHLVEEKGTGIKTVDEVRHVTAEYSAKLLGVPESTVTLLIKRDRLKTKRIGGVFYIYESSLNSFIKESERDKKASDVVTLAEASNRLRMPVEDVEEKLRRGRLKSRQYRYKIYVDPESLKHFEKLLSNRVVIKGKPFHTLKNASLLLVLSKTLVRRIFEDSLDNVIEVDGVMYFSEKHLKYIL